MASRNCTAALLLIVGLALCLSTPVHGAAKDFWCAKKQPNVWTNASAQVVTGSRAFGNSYALHGDIFVPGKPSTDLSKYTKVGVNYGTCTRITEYTFYCLFTFELLSGEAAVTVQGGYDGIKGSKLAITGGTGYMAGVSGTVQASEINPISANTLGVSYTFKFTQAVTKCVS